MGRKDYDLENLAMPAGSMNPEAMAEIEPIDLDNIDMDELLKDIVDYDSEMKLINEYIWLSKLVTWGPGLWYRQFDRMKDLFGFRTDSECSEWLLTHGEQDAYVGELLVSDALYTGRRDELPDGLKSIYDTKLDNKR